MDRRYFPILFFRTHAGHDPVREWVNNLTAAERKTIGDDLKTVQFGWPMGMPLIKKIEPGLWEVRTRLDNKNARVIFTVAEGHIVLLHGFFKKSQKLSADDLHIARARLRDTKGERNEK